MKRETNWHEYDEGFSIGTSGADVGVIVRDEEHPDGARITLEEDGSFAPFSISCGIYGWMFHTRYFSDETEANAQFDRMKIDLEEILQSIPEDLDAADEETMALVSEEINSFVEKHP